MKRHYISPMKKALDAKAQAVAAEYQNNANEVAILRQQLAERDATIASMQSQLSQRDGIIASLRSSESSLKTQLSQIGNASKNEVSTLQKQLADLQLDKSELRNDKLALKEQIEMLKSVVSLKETEANIAKSQLEQLQKEVVDNQLASVSAIRQEEQSETAVGVNPHPDTTFSILLSENAGQQNIFGQDVTHSSYAVEEIGASGDQQDD